jgi:hypothetical protein
MTFLSRHCVKFGGGGGGGPHLSLLKWNSEASFAGSDLQSIQQAFSPASPYAYFSYELTSKHLQEATDQHI